MVTVVTVVTVYQPLVGSFFTMRGLPCASSSILTPCGGMGPPKW